MIFGRALLLLQLVDDRLDFLVADADVDLAPQIAVPRQLCLDLPLERAFRRPDAAQIGAHVRGRLAEVAADDRIVALVDFLERDFDVRGLGFLDLERLVDQLTDHEQAVLRHFLFGQLHVARGEQKGETLVDVGPGDHRSVDDRGWLADVGIHLAKNLWIARQIEIAGAVDRCLRRGAFLRRGVGSGLRDRSSRHGERSREHRTEPETAHRARRLACSRRHQISIPSRMAEPWPCP
ncbi:hypothetical protein ABIC16_002451 [Sphingomonas sp. PvP055]